jgi:hypothetical protein
MLAIEEERQMLRTGRDNLRNHIDSVVIQTFNPKKLRGKVSASAEQINQVLNYFNVPKLGERRCTLNREHLTYSLLRRYIVKHTDYADEMAQDLASEQEYDSVAAAA